MKSPTAILGILAFSLSLQAATAVVADVSNPLISPNIVVGDTINITITGAATNALVTLYYTVNGGSTQTFYAGYTDGSGYYSDSSVKDNTFKGVWTEQWNVGGTNVGPFYTFEVVGKPYSLAVQSVTAASPTCGSTAVPDPNGVLVNIKYAIRDAGGSAVTASGVLLEPYEENDYFSYGGAYLGSDAGDIGASGTPWSPPSAKYASTAGVFYDIPLGLCAGPGTYSGWAWSQQYVYIKIGSFYYPVRYNAFVSSGTGSGFGSVTNGSDISYSH